MIVKLILFCSIVFFNTACIAGVDLSKRAWIDLPQELPSFCAENVNCDVVSKFIDQYHSLDKAKLENLQERSAMLEKIAQELDSISAKIQECKKMEVLQSLALIARKKSWYLEKIQKVDDGFDQDLDLYMHTNLKDKLNGYFVLPLFNNVFHDSRLDEYFGLYWLEVLDPCHRLNLTQYYVRWKQHVGGMAFFVWLETQEMPHESPQIEIFDIDSLDDLTYTFSKEEHLLYDSYGNVANLANDREYNYVISLDKKIFIAEDNQQVRHTTLTGGGPVLGSGMIEVKFGKITCISGVSGHYQPSLFFIKQAIDLFNEFGANLNKDVRVKYYKNYKLFDMSLEDFLLNCSSKIFEDGVPAVSDLTRYMPDFTIH